MPTINKFEELEIWKNARELCKDIQDLINKNERFLKDYALRDQISRSTGSIMDNIAEGFGRGGNKEFHNFLSYSMGSCLEAKSQIYRAFDFHYIDQIDKDRMIESIDTLSFKIIAFMRYLRKTDIKGSKYNKK
jgi:four helix bundle protein